MEKIKPYLGVNTISGGARTGCLASHDFAIVVRGLEKKQGQLGGEQLVEVVSSDDLETRLQHHAKDRGLSIGQPK